MTMRRIDKIILHCSATSAGKHFDVNEIRKWHVEGRGWKDIGYHYIVYIDGQVVVGRPVETPGAHTQGHNKNSIGVCYVGGVSNIKDKKGKFPAEDTRTPEQKEALWKLLMELMACYDGATLHGHNEFAAKACPSFDVQKEYKDVIKFYANN